MNSTDRQRLTLLHTALWKLPADISLFEEDVDWQDADSYHAPDGDSPSVRRDNRTE